MLRRLRVCVVSAASVLSVSALASAAEPTDPTTEASSPDDDASDGSKSEKPQPDAQSSQVHAAAPDVNATREGITTAPHPPTEAEQKPPEVPPETPQEDWHVEVHGYFRAPLALGISTRPNPDTPDGPAKTQISYAPNRTVDSNYYSFAYTRLQEQDWAEVTFHAKKKHVDAAVGWMGYWLSAAGFRNPDAAGVPGVASLRLDTDLDTGSLKPNIAVQMGAWWPGFGYFEKYDTFTLGRFRHIGEQVKATIPVDSDLTLEAVQGFGVGRNGAFSYNVAASSPLYASKVGAVLIAYGNLRATYKKYLDIGLHINNEWTRDPYLTADADPTSGKAYSDAASAHMTVVGGEANLAVPYVGRLWISPSYISVKNGWALGDTSGTEVVHAQGGLGIASNYLAWSGSPPDSTGSGSLFNFGFLYENSLSNVQGKALGSLPDVKLNIFGLLTSASLDLPAGSSIGQSSIKQIKYGADVTLQALKWLGVTLRGDTVNYDREHDGYIFSSITSRLTFSSHFLSTESLYLQYSRYIYGDNMVLAGKWPWGTQLVAGSDVVQGGFYARQKPDQDVIKLQASVLF